MLHLFVLVLSLVCLSLTEGVQVRKFGIACSQIIIVYLFFVGELQLTAASILEFFSDKGSQFLYVYLMIEAPDFYIKAIWKFVLFCDFSQCTIRLVLFFPSSPFVLVSINASYSLQRWGRELPLLLDCIIFTIWNSICV